MATQQPPSRRGLTHKPVRPTGVPAEVFRLYDLQAPRFAGSPAATALHKLIFHPDMPEVYRFLSKKRATNENWRDFLRTAIAAQSHALKLPEFRARYEAAIAAMQRIDEHAPALHAALNEFWDAATYSYLNFEQIQLLDVPIEALTYPGYPGNDNSVLVVHGLPFRRPPLAPLIEKLADAARAWTPVPNDLGMLPASRGEETAQNAFVVDFDALWAASQSHECIIDPKPLAITALVMLRRGMETQRADWGKWAGKIRVDRHRLNRPKAAKA